MAMLFSVKDNTNNTNYLTRIKQVSECEILISQKGMCNDTECVDVVLIDIPKILLAMSHIEGFGDCILIDKLPASYKDIWMQCTGEYNGESKE